ncbi:MAG: hypothetical protein WDN27_03935 [Candidatus Saccharibacteria bacterium]
MNTPKSLPQGYEQRDLIKSGTPVPGVVAVRAGFDPLTLEMGRRTRIGVANHPEWTGGLLLTNPKTGAEVGITPDEAAKGIAVGRAMLGLEIDDPHASREAFDLWTDGANGLIVARKPSEADRTRKVHLNPADDRSDWYARHMDPTDLTPEIAADGRPIMTRLPGDLR